MVFKLFGEITTSYKTTPNVMPYFAIIALNTYGKKTYQYFACSF